MVRVTEKGANLKTMIGVFDLFSKRQKALRGELPDVYVYDKIPNPLKIQIIHIWGDALGNEDDYLESNRGTKNAY
jgi:hypothetical protein